MPVEDLVVSVDNLYNSATHQGGSAGFSYRSDHQGSFLRKARFPVWVSREGASSATRNGRRSPCPGLTFAGKCEALKALSCVFDHTVAPCRCRMSRLRLRRERRSLGHL